jgi:hypothetical protein
MAASGSGKRARSALMSLRPSRPDVPMAIK